MFTSLLYNKGYDEGYRNNQMKRYIGSEVQELCPVELRYTTYLACGCIQQPGSSPYPVLLEFLYRLYHVGMIHHQFLAPLSGEWGPGGEVSENPKLPKVLVFLATDPLPEGHPELPHWNKSHLSPRNFQGI